MLFRLHFDGAFQYESKGVVVAGGLPDPEKAAQEWLTRNAAGKSERGDMVDLLLQAWWCLIENKSFAENLPTEEERRAGWRAGVNGKTVEIGWLARRSQRLARFETLTLTQIGL